MTLIALNKLHPDSRNANVCGPDVIEKLHRHIKQNGLCQHLLVRPHPKKPKQFIIVDGHHRLQVAEALGWKEIDCQIKEMDDEQARLLLLTLNRLRGTDIPRKRAELLESLLPSFSLEDLSGLLPESVAEIEGLLALLKLDEENLEKALIAQIEAEKKTLPVPFGFMIPAEEAGIIKEALSVYQAKTKADQGEALVAICRDVLSINEVPNEKA